MSYVGYKYLMECNGSSDWLKKSSSEQWGPKRNILHYGQVEILTRSDHRSYGLVEGTGFLMPPPVR